MSWLKVKERIFKFDIPVTLQKKYLTTLILTLSLCYVSAARGCSWASTVSTPTPAGRVLSLGVRTADGATYGRRLLAPAVHPLSGVPVPSDSQRHSVRFPWRTRVTRHPVSTEAPVPWRPLISLPVPVLLDILVSFTGCSGPVISYLCSWICSLIVWNENYVYSKFYYAE